MQVLDSFARVVMAQGKISKAGELSGESLTLNQAMTAALGIGSERVAARRGRRIVPVGRSRGGERPHANPARGDLVARRIRSGNACCRQSASGGHFMRCG
jgi:hypothetical protein